MYEYFIKEVKNVVSVYDHDGASSQGTGYVRRCSGSSLSEVCVVSCA